MRRTNCQCASRATLAANGGLRIWLRNEGIGWLAFNITPAAKEGLATFFSKELGHTLTTH